MKRMLTIKADNKGFSLVELLIAVTIATIVGASIFGFMKVGAKTFNFNSSDVNLQNESQLAFNQMQDLIIDTAVGVQYFAKASGGGSLTPVGADSEIGSSDDKLLRLNNTDYVYDIWWDRDAKLLYYNEYVANYDSSTGIVTPGAVKVDDTNGLMSEYVSDFSVDLSRLETSRVVRVDLTYEKGGRVLSTTHNITLRNQVVSGNKVEENIRDAFTISENAVFNDPIGKSIIYVEPGDRNINLKTIVDDDPGSHSGERGYRVYNTDDSLNAAETDSLRFGFASGSSVDIGYTTIGYSTGVLNISPNQTSDFNIIVYCQSDNTKKKPVIVRVVRNNGISIDFQESNGATNEVKASPTETDDHDGNHDKFADDLAEGERFRLTATPDINYKSSDVDASGKMRSTDPVPLSSSDISKLDDIKSDIEAKIYFEGDTGYPTLFKEETGENLHCGVNPCKFEMSSNFRFTGEVEEYYQETIKALAKCGHSEEKGISVPPGEWTGKAYKKKSNYTIKKGGSKYQRGDQIVTHMLDSGNYVRNYGDFTCQSSPSPDLSSSPGGFWANHIELLDVKVTEHPGDRVVDPSKYILADGSGNWKWICPLDWDPNKQYTYEITSHIAHTRAGSQEHNATYVMPHTSDTGYTYKKSDYELTSNTITFTFDRLRLDYSLKSDYSNVKRTEFTPADIPEDTVEENAKSSYVTYYVRGFAKEPNSSKYPSGMKYFESASDGQAKGSQIELNVKWSNSFAFGDYTKQYLFNNGRWKAYEISYDNDGVEKLSEYSSRDIISDYEDNEMGRNGNVKMFRYYNSYNLSGVGLNGLINLLRNNPNEVVYSWGHKVPSRLRVIPVFGFKGNNSNTVVPYEITDNYVDCVFWNIKIPYQSWAGKVYRTTEIGEAYENCFFPGPEDIGFPSATSTEKRWYYAGFDLSSNYQEEGKDYYHLYYTLQDLGDYWKLTLNYHDSNGKSEKIASYRYDAKQKIWVFTDI